MVTFDAVVKDFHICLTEHLVVEFLGDDVWEHLLAILMDTSSLTTREFSQSGFSGCIPISCPPILKLISLTSLRTKQPNVCHMYNERTIVNKVSLAP